MHSKTGEQTCNQDTGGRVLLWLKETLWKGRKQKERRSGLKTEKMKETNIKGVVTET
jgi:hypothetical protein